MPFKLTIFRYDCIIANFTKGFCWISRIEAIGIKPTFKFWILQPHMLKLLAALVYQEVLYQTLLLTSVTESLGNIVLWDKKHILPILSFNLTRSVSTQANHVGFTKPSNYLLLWYNHLLEAAFCIIIKILNNCRWLAVLCPGVTQLKTIQLKLKTISTIFLKN